MKHLTPDDKRYILLRHKQGASLRGIGREIGRPDITIRRTLEAAGIVFGPPKTSNKRSSPETEAHVLRLYDEGLTWKAINEQAGVTSVTVAKILERNGRDPDRKPEGAESKGEIIAALSESGHSARAIGRMLGHSKSTVRNIIDDLGAESTPTQGCEYPDFFEEIDTPEKAYWLGFLSADGCIKTTARHPEGDYLSIELGLQDAGHLAKLKTALGVYRNVRKAIKRNNGRIQGYAALAVGSRRLAIALMALGIGPRKSATVEPWDGPADLMPHFWRGLFDGDGSLAIKDETQFTAFLCGSEACVRAFQAWAHEICGTEATPYFRTGCWYVSIAGRYQVPKLVRAMYADAPVSLDRKQERADAILAADGPRKKPGPASRFATEEEALANRRKVHREAQRRYKQRQKAAESPA
jgi:hypothetical protein